MAHRILRGSVLLGLLASGSAAQQPGGGLPKGGRIGNFPSVAFPPGNPSTPEKIQLGMALFFEEQLSADNTMACATCHLPEAGGADVQAGLRAPGQDGRLGTRDDGFGSPGMIRQDRDGGYAHHPIFGVERQATGLNAPSVIGAAFFESLFWDMRAASTFRNLSGTVVLPRNAALESQAVAPATSSVEMGHAGMTWDEITTKLATVRPLGLATDLPRALAHFLRQSDRYGPLFARVFGSPEITRERIAMAIATYERSLVPDQTPFDLGTMTPEQATGFEVFLERGNCETCHNDGGLFSDGLLNSVSLPDHPAFVKTPTLRNVGLRKRFMHSGQFASLDEVVTHYESIGFFTPPLGTEERRALLAFLGNALTDPRVARRLPPFDRPTLRSELAPFGSNQFGLGSPGTGGFVPTLISNAPANLGHTGFKIGLGNARGGSLALLAISRTPSPPGTIVRGVPVLITLAGADFLSATLSGTEAGKGTATFPIPLPADPALIGEARFVQAFVRDPNAIGGIAASRGAAFKLF